MVVMVVIEMMMMVMMMIVIMMVMVMMITPVIPPLHRSNFCLPRRAGRGISGVRRVRGFEQGSGIWNRLQ